MELLQRYCEIISNLQKLGKDYNWVVVSTDINTNIANKDELEINKYFLSLIDNNIDLYQSIKNEIFGCSYMTEKQKGRPGAAFFMRCKFGYSGWHFDPLQLVIAFLRSGFSATTLAWHSRQVWCFSSLLMLCITK